MDVIEIRPEKAEKVERYSSSGTTILPTNTTILKKINDLLI